MATYREIRERRNAVLHHDWRQHDRGGRDLHLRICDPFEVCLCIQSQLPSRSLEQRLFSLNDCMVCNIWKKLWLPGKLGRSFSLSLPAVEIFQFASSEILHSLAIPDSLNSINWMARIEIVTNFIGTWVQPRKAIALFLLLLCCLLLLLLSLLLLLR